MAGWINTIFSEGAHETIITEDWFGAAASAVRFKFVETAESLIIGGMVESAPLKITEATFKEGLWNGEVIEFFLVFQGGGYLEVNIAPGGAHWVCAFSGYRERREVFSKTIFQLFAGAGVNSWRAAIVIPRNILPGTLTKIHYAAILGSTNRRYLASHVAPGIKPDFHGFAKVSSNRLL